MDAVVTKPTTIVPPSGDDIAASRKKITDLRKGRLPRMVNWWDIRVLTQVGLRTLISSTIGSYADQRPIQAASDNAPEDELTGRHDYREVCPGGVDENGTRAVETADGRWTLDTGGGTKSLGFDGEGALWVDFVADLGDGFEATYAMAYLLAQPAIIANIPEANGKTMKQRLPAGEILIIGGDMAYPDATVEQYRTNCIDPYNSAFQIPPETPAPRKLFFIAGNHDWYDGLAAFTSVFCTARDRLSRGKGLTLGGWQSDQRRSYFALALPHGWWFWGIDLALNLTLDEGQKSYFEAVSQKTNPGEKIVIVVHAPVWMTNHDSPLHEVSQWARRRGAEVVCVLAGDFHYYSRYHSMAHDKVGARDAKLPQPLQLITAGGGGAFLHPTHQLSRKMDVHWTVPRKTAGLPRTTGADYTDKVATVTAAEELTFDKSKPFRFQLPHIYPARSTSMGLALRNLALPFHNWKFALFIGFFYLVYAWVFQISTLNPTDAIRRAHQIALRTIEVQCSLRPEIEQQCIKDRTANLDADSLTKQILDLQKRKPAEANHSETALPSAADETNAQPATTASQTPHASTNTIPNLLRRAIALVQPSKATTVVADAANQLDTTIDSIYRNGGWGQFAWRVIWSQINTERLLYAMLNNPAFLFMIVGLYVGLIRYVGFDDGDFIRPRWLKWPAKIVIGGTHAWLHVTTLLTLNYVLQPIYSYFSYDGATWPWILGGLVLYSAIYIVAGGILGGTIFGLYWVLTSLIGGMHTDSFGALRIANYKNFLRMRIEPDRMTIYPIGLTKVPGPRGWRALNAKDDTSGHNPLIKPKRPLRPHLIEMPIEILAPRPPAQAPAPVSTPSQTKAAAPA